MHGDGWYKGKETPNYAMQGTQSRVQSQSLCTVIIMVLSALNHWVLVCHHSPASPCDLQEPLFFSCRCTRRCIHQLSVCSNMYYSLMLLTICFPKIPVTFRRKNVGKNQSWHYWIIWNLLSSLPNFCCLVVGKTGRLILYIWILVISFICIYHVGLWMSEVRYICKWLVCIYPFDLKCESKGSYTL